MKYSYVLLFGFLCYAAPSYGQSYVLDSPEVLPPIPSQNDIARYPKRRPPTSPSRKDSEPDFRVAIADTQLWIQPDTSHLTWLLDILEVRMSFSEKAGWLMGVDMEVAGIRLDRWLGSLSTGDHTLTETKWGRLAYHIGYGPWKVRAGFLVLRELEWGFPDPIMNSLKQTYHTKQEKSDQFSLTSQSPMAMLPLIQTGLSFGPFSMHVGGELLSWDLRGYRGDVQAAVQGRFLKVSAKASYIKDAGRFATPALLVWCAESWETQFMVELNLLKLFLPKKVSVWGPVVLSAGARYRHVLQNQVMDLQGKTLWQETPGGLWSMGFGLTIGAGFGSNLSRLNF
ncbi:MAG: hypothetical protein L7F78_07725 [Syntrophales bacterium LBB04]|nr:hypothetical protein [Syntrophales bacterium LBB04]